MDTFRRATLSILTGLIRWLTPTPPVDQRLERARVLVRRANYLEVRGELVSGERRRHQVLSQLAAEFPDARLRDLAFLIERVLQETT